jgi:hypothetical protein
MCDFCRRCFCSRRLIVRLDKSGIRSGLHGVFSSLRQPTAASDFVAVEQRHIRFDVQKRRPIQYVHVLDQQGGALDSRKSDDGQTYGIGSSRGPRSEHASQSIVQEWSRMEAIALGSVQVVNQNDVRETVEILEPGRQFGIQFNGPFHSRRPDGLNRHALNLGKRGMDDADGLKCNIVSGSHLPCEIAFRLRNDVKEGFQQPLQSLSIILVPDAPKDSEAFGSLVKGFLVQIRYQYGGGSP